MLYFDHNATSPLCEAARTAWLDATSRLTGNPSSPHRLGARADAALTEAREWLADCLGCDAHEVIWTSGATEAANAVFHHSAAQAGDGNGEVWISAIEHPCVVEAARKYFPGRVRLLRVAREGVIDVDHLREEFGAGRPVLVAVMAANNETGVLQPWKVVAELCAQYGVPFFCDAAQWVGKLPASGLGVCDFVSGCGHKFGGPQGVGFLKVTRGFHALLAGGPQEDGRRAGTENVAGILAMVAALRMREEVLAGDGAAVRTTMRQEFEAGLGQAVPDVKVIGKSSERLWNTVSVMMPGLPDCRRRWVVKLDKLGFAVSTGSACASGKEVPSHVITALGYDASEAGRVLRFSSGWETSSADWRALLEGIGKAFGELSEG